MLFALPLHNRLLLQRMGKPILHRHDDLWRINIAKF